jgi:hypothetical protein
MDKHYLVEICQSIERDAEKAVFYAKKDSAQFTKLVLESIVASAELGLREINSQKKEEL